MNAFDTHEVFNQAPPFEDVNLFGCDLALQEAVAREGAGWARVSLHALGATLGCAATFELGRQANAHPPVLRSADRGGRRIDEIKFHSSWHQLMALMIGAGVHAAPWDSGQAGAQAAQFMLFGQVENGTQCPVRMTYASVPALRLAGALGAAWLPKILSRHYDPRSLQIAQKRGALIGMGMTEKQGGSDVRANTTRATLRSGRRAAALWGRGRRGLAHRRPQVVFLGAAVGRAPGPGPDRRAWRARQRQPVVLSGAALPARWQRNPIRIQRLNDKLGNRPNAWSEVEFCDAFGWLVGQAGRGIATILAMGSHTRLDCVLGSAAIVHAALTHALHRARGRHVFGRTLAEQPLMQNVLADMALESKATTTFAPLRRAGSASAAGAGAHASRQVLAAQARPRFLQRGDGGHGRRWLY